MIDEPVHDRRCTDKGLCVAVLSHEDQLAQGAIRMANIEQSLADNTAATNRVDASTKEIVDFFNSVKGAFKVLNWVGKLATPIGAIIGLGTAAWAAWTALKSGVHK